MTARASDGGGPGGAAMAIEVWSDVVCPWCYVGKRNLDTALDELGPTEPVAVVWRAFELDSTAPSRVGMTMSQVLQRKYHLTGEQADAANQRMTRVAAEAGLEYHLADVQPGNTFDAHRLGHLAAAHGRGDAMQERLFAAYFTEGRSVSEHGSLLDLGAEAGLDRAEVSALLAGDRFADAVRRDESMAASLGVTAVPFFVIDRRYGIAGAQPPEVVLATLERARSATPGPVPPGQDPAVP